MEKTNKTDLTQQEFFGLMMLYAANIDGEQHENELRIITESIGEESFVRCQTLFDSMNDYELINFFRDHKGDYLKSDMDEKIFLSEIKTVVSADHHVDVMEKALLLALKKILKE